MKMNKFTIQKYSGFAGVFLLMHNDTFGQAVYTDINPDIYLQYDGETAGIDMDNDGDFDFAFLKLSYYWSSTFSTEYEFRHALWCGPYGTPENEIAGESVTHGAGGGASYFPYAFVDGNLINYEFDFQYWGYQRMGGGHYNINGSLWSWGYDVGHWAPNVDSLYLGVRFIDNEDCRHYGWIRCSTIDSAKTLIIHDYAYETKCETGISAGDTIGDTTSIGINEINSLNAFAYCFDKEIFIHNNTGENISITIYNISGRQIISTETTDNFLIIPMQKEMSGIYFVKLQSGEKQFIREIEI